MPLELVKMPCGAHKTTLEDGENQEGNGVDQYEACQRPHDDPASMILDQSKVIHADREFGQARD